MSEINPEFLLGAMPPAEATLYGVLLQLIPAPIPETPNRGGRQIEMALLAKRTGFTKRWVIELMKRLEKKSFIRTDGGSGAVKWIWLLPLGVPRLGRPIPLEITMKAAPRPGKTKAPRAAASQTKRSDKESVQSQKADVDINVTPPKEKPAAIPARYRKGSPPSIPPANPASDNPVVSTTMVTPPPPPAPADPALPAAMTPPAPLSTAPGGPAARNPRVPAAKIEPTPSKAPRDLATDNVVVPAVTMPPAPSAPSSSSAARNRMPAARVAPPPPTAAPAAPGSPAAKRISPHKSTQKLPEGHSHWKSAPIEELVAYACSIPATPELIRNLKVPGMTPYRLLRALELLCQRIERDGVKPCQDRWELISTLRTILSDR